MLHIFWSPTEPCYSVLQIQGTKVCLGVDALNEGAMQMTRFVAPVTMLATGGAGQVEASAFLISLSPFPHACQIFLCIALLLPEEVDLYEY